MNSFNSISPIDGRYKSKVEPLANYFSEAALFQYRVKVEIEYFIALVELQLPQLVGFPINLFPELIKIYSEFSLDDVNSIKNIEKTTNHDVKAVEYFIKDKFISLLSQNNIPEAQINHWIEFIHFGLTSQDINNVAIPLSLKDALTEQIYPLLFHLVKELEFGCAKWSRIPMLARTHGQPASPTVLGKEIYVFVERLKNQLKLIDNLNYPAKFGGATGNFNAHTVAFPHINWDYFANNFIENKLGLTRSQTTTQIEHYDRLSEIFGLFVRINVILTDFSRDIWSYISINYFNQKIKAGEIGSSAMPHKVNPIDFENAEGNFGFANAIFQFFIEKLPISRLQRDLTDSTTLRNLGVPFAHTVLAIKSLLTGFAKLEVNEAMIEADLDNHWEVIAEAIQTILRREGFPKPYEALKELTRSNEKITKEAIHIFIQNLNVSENIKQELLAITPFNYVGNAL